MRGDGEIFVLADGLDEAEAQLKAGEILITEDLDALLNDVYEAGVDKPWAEPYNKPFTPYKFDMRSADDKELEALSKTRVGRRLIKQHRARWIKKIMGRIKLSMPKTMQLIPEESCAVHRLQTIEKGKRWRCRRCGRNFGQESGITEYELETFGGQASEE